MQARKLVMLIGSFLVAACAPLSFDAPFVMDASQRQAFVESIVIGQTTDQQVIARWGDPTSGSDRHWAWSSGSASNGASVLIFYDDNGVVEHVQSGIVGRQDNFAPRRLSAAASPQVQQQSPQVAQQPVAQIATQPQASSEELRVSSPAGPITPALFEQMQEFAEANPTPQAFFARFGNPYSATSIDAAFAVLEDIDTYFYGAPPETFFGASVASTDCTDAPQIAVNIFEGLVYSVQTNMPGYTFC